MKETRPVLIVYRADGENIRVSSDWSNIPLRNFDQRTCGDIRWLVGFFNSSELNPTIRVRYILPVVVFIGVVDSGFDAIGPGFCGLRWERLGHDVGRKVAVR